MKILSFIEKKLLWALATLGNCTGQKQVLGIGNHLALYKHLIETCPDQELVERVRAEYVKRVELLHFEKEAPLGSFLYEMNLFGVHASEVIGGLEKHYHMYKDQIRNDYGKFDEYLVKLNQYGIWKRKMLKAKSVKQAKYYARYAFLASKHFPKSKRARFWKFYRLTISNLQRKEVG